MTENIFKILESGEFVRRSRKMSENGQKNLFSVIFVYLLHQGTTSSTSWELSDIFMHVTCSMCQFSDILTLPKRKI